MNTSGNINLKSRPSKPDKGRRSWSRQEEEILIAALKGIVASGWKSENGFKMGFLNVLEQELVKAIPGTDLRGMPHINSKIHVWKKIMIDGNARLMHCKSWSFYYDWIEIFGKDRATGQQVEDIFEAVSNVNLSGSARPDSQPEDMNDINYGTLEDFNDTMSESNPQSSAGTKKSTGCKRKSSESTDPLCEIMKSFSGNTSTRLMEIATRLGYDYGISRARKDVFSFVCGIEGLNLQEQLLVSKILVKNTDEMDFF
ncbi:Unknown protein [Striga hermonthica]|uniref:Myb/SANT-like domain-containing protein n=1 Tax=Striga hermonthica TaxID=68872 RepID=A0A9N7P0S7_STRHE|nr:Unknown protein [Striga hermonthica]